VVGIICLKAYFEIQSYLSHFEDDNDVDSTDTRDTRLAHFIPDQTEIETLQGLLSTLETYQDANNCNTIIFEE